MTIACFPWLNEETANFLQIVSLTYHPAAFGAYFVSLKDGSLGERKRWIWREKKRNS